MSKSSLTHIGWALVALISFTLGHLANESSAERHATAGPILPSAAISKELTAAAPYILEPRQDASPHWITEAEASARTFDLLLEPNRGKRLRAFSDLLEGITPDNWRGVMDAFVRQTAFEGREHSTEWNLMLERVGEVAGLQGVEDALGSNGIHRHQRAAVVLNGWAGAQPESAVAWFQTQTPDVQQQLIPALVGGLARTDPAQALAIALTQPQEAFDRTISQIVDGAIQRGGLREAEALLASIRHDPEVHQEAKRRVFIDLSRKRVNMARLRGVPFDALEWMDNYLGASSPAGPTAVREIVSSAAEADAGGAVQWLEERADRMSPEQLEVAFPAAIESLAKQSPVEFTAWMSNNSDHPQYERIVEVTVNRLLRSGEADQARHWVGTVRDQQARAQMEQIVQKFQESTRAPQ